jgi:hypothetical protein
LERNRQTMKRKIWRDTRRTVISISEAGPTPVDIGQD